MATLALHDPVLSFTKGSPILTPLEASGHLHPNTDLMNARY